MITVHTLAHDPWQPGTIGRCTALMSRFYSEKFGLGVEFERSTAAALASFVECFDPRRDAMWLVRRDDDLVGCAAVDGQSPTGDAAQRSAQFRWFFLGASTRGHGLGRQLLGRAIAFARGAGYASLDLCTHSDLAAAVHLYESHGFVPCGTEPGVHWGKAMVLSRYSLPLRDVAADTRARAARPGAPVQATASAALRAAA